MKCHVINVFFGRFEQASFPMGIIFMGMLIAFESELKMPAIAALDPQCKLFI